MIVPTELTLYPHANSITPVPISIIDDQIPEEDEEFQISVNFQGSGQGDLYAKITVVDDDCKVYYTYTLRL